MSFIRRKEIPPGSGNFYNYQVKTVHVGGKVQQKVIQYLGKTGAVTEQLIDDPPSPGPEVPEMICKYCGSTRTRRFGHHPNYGQRYRCHDCNHTFTDNRALPGMQIDKAIVDRFISLRKESKTLSQIQDILREEYRHKFSKSTLAKWDHKFPADLVSEQRWKRSMSAFLEIARKNEGKTLSGDAIKELFGYSRSTKVEDTQPAIKGIIQKTGKGLFTVTYRDE